MGASERGSFLPGWLFLLAMMTALAPLSIDMYLPAFPAIADSLEAESADVQVTLAVFLLGMSIGQLVYGPLSDRYGRKPPLYVGLTFYILASFVCMFADDLATLTIARFLQALGGSAGVVVSRAVIRDRTTTEQGARAFSMLMLALGLAPILAPLVGGLVLSAVGWRGIFGLLAAMAIVLLIFMHVTMIETVSRLSSDRLGLKGTSARYLNLLSDWAFLKYVLIGGLPYGGLFAYIAASPFLIIELHGVDPQHFGWLFGLNAFGLIAGSQINARLVTRLGPGLLLRRVVWVPGIASTIGFCSVVFGFESLPLLMFCFFLFLTSLGFLGPNAMALAMEKQGHRAGAASAVMGALQFLLGTIGGIAVTLWTLPSALPITAIMLGFGASSLCIHHLSIKEAGRVTSNA